MKYISILIGAIMSLTALANLLYAESNDLFVERMNRWQARAVNPERNALDDSYAPYTNFPKALEALFNDVLINSDNSQATFNQRFSDIAHFSDGRGVVVWEDERNGIYQIAAQPLSATGVPTGSNFFVDSGNPPVVHRQPVVAANSIGTVLVLYVKESTNGLYARRYDNAMVPVGGEYRVDDDILGNRVNQPAIGLLSSNRFVVVWEDSRSGANIYGQILNSDGSKSGDNFQINQTIASPYRIAPAVSSSFNGDFAVIWEDGRTNNGDVYMRIFTDIGTPLFPELLLDAAHAADYQFMPKLQFLTANGYFAAWISDRDGGQSIYGQLVSTSSSPVGSSFRINDSDNDLCWDLDMTGSSDSGVVCIWAEYSTMASIEVQKISKTATIVGANAKIEDSGLIRERSFPAISRNSTGLTAAWTDQRNDDQDIYAQRLGTDLSKSSDNYKINGDINGAQQFSPALTPITVGSVGIVWQDRRSDQGDIYLQRINATGTVLGVNTRVNDDLGLAIQSNPKISSTSNGSMIAVWEDTRTDDGLSGQNIFVQRLDGMGNILGNNVLVNTDATSRPKSNPDIHISSGGKVCVVWIDEGSFTQQIFGQCYTSNLTPVGGNFQISNLPIGTQNIEPHVGMLNSGTFVIAWLAIVEGKQLGFFQLFNSMNQAVGANRMLEIDTVTTQVVDIDVAAHATEDRFYISSVENENGEINVMMYSFDGAGNAVNSPATVSDIPGAYSDVSIATDVGDAIGVSWSKALLSGDRNLFQIMRNDGFALGSNQMVSASAANRVENAPAGVMVGGHFYHTWSDSRDANAGFNIYANSYQYTSTDVEDEHDIILPAEFSLEQNFPNPFNPETKISYSLSKSSHVKLTIHNILGQQVAVLVDDYQSSGRHEVSWRSDRSRNASGVYFYRLTVNDHAITKKMTLVK